METLLTLSRCEESTNGKATIGKLYIGGFEECWTLEDKVREVPSQPVSMWKVPGQTAIPHGTFVVEIDYSSGFSHFWSTKLGKITDVFTPHLLDVPGFDGIRIHAGQTDADTDGCILLGQAHPAQQDFIGSSQTAVRAFMPKLAAALNMVIHKDESQPDFYQLWRYEQLLPAGLVRIQIKNIGE
jgi:hypothetical protein